MKRRLLRTALAFCLCAPAAPLWRSPDINTELPEDYSIRSDLEIHSVDLEVPLATDEQPALIATGIDSLGDEDFTIDDTYISGSRSPEPPPAVMVAVGLGFVAVFAVPRRFRTEKSRARASSRT